MRGDWENSQAYKLEQQATAVASKVKEYGEEILGFLKNHPEVFQALKASSDSVRYSAELVCAAD